MAAYFLNRPHCLNTIMIITGKWFYNLLYSQQTYFKYLNTFVIMCMIIKVYFEHFLVMIPAITNAKPYPSHCEWSIKF